MTGRSVSVRGLSDDRRAWRSPRRDTRGERGYDGSGLRGYDGSGLRGYDGVRAGMTEKRGAGMSGRSVSVRGLSDDKRAWRSPRRDTRGKRGYDGSGLRGYDGVRAGMTEKRGAGMSGRSVSVRGSSDDKRAWRSPRRDTRGKRGYDGSISRGYDGSISRGYDGSISRGYDGSGLRGYDGSVLCGYDGGVNGPQRRSGVQMPLRAR